MNYLKKLTAKKANISGGAWADELSALRRLMDMLAETHDIETNSYSLPKKKQDSYNYKPETLAKIKEIESKLREIYPELLKLNKIVSFQSPEFEE